MPTVRLGKLVCNETTEGGEDEVFIEKYVDGATEPVKIWEKNDVHAVNEYPLRIDVGFESVVEIRVVEHDNPLEPNDLIGSITVTTQRGGPFDEHMTDGGDYHLIYRVS